MSSVRSRGQVIRTEGSRVVFQPTGTNYELHLDPVGGAFAAPMNSAVDVVIRVKARKLYTVPSGGNFVTPIQGTPKILQGRVKAIEGAAFVLQCGAFITVELPTDNDSNLELASGPVQVGALVNVICYSGATIELAGRPVGTP